jgi:hypothetical protein
MTRTVRYLTPKAALPLVATAALAGGCVIPIAPQFDDPETNYPPYVETSNPGVGEIFTLGMTQQDRDISAILSDQNVNDFLYIRWLVDYPGTDANPAHLVLPLQLPPSGMMVRSRIRLQPTCRDLGIGSGLHRLVLSVADRPYQDALSGESVDPEAPLDSVDLSEANRIRLVWLLSCP